MNKIENIKLLNSHIHILENELEFLIFAIIKIACDTETLTKKELNLIKYLKEFRKNPYVTEHIVLQLRDEIHFKKDSPFIMNILNKCETIIKNYNKIKNIYENKDKI